jgi:type II secretory pathway predicted ATPase ExeA/cytoskeletal protein CcmA (bactofilin family)
MVITGIVECHGRVVLEGVVEGSFSGRILEIRETGRISGDVTAQVIDCSGHMEGNVVTDTLALRKTGCHVGTVRTRKLAVDRGASFDCVLQSGASKVVEPVETIKEPDGKPKEPDGKPVISLRRLLFAFSEGTRPCCMDVPWSNRLKMYNSLLELLAKGKPLIKVTGDNGSGKSVLVDKLRRSLPPAYEILLVTDQVGSVASLLQGVANDLMIALQPGVAQGELLAQIKTVLDEKRRCGQRVVLLIDDTENMYPATMEGIIRLLTNAYGEGEEMLQMILLGTEAMETKMVATTIEYFEDETNCQLHLEPLSLKDAADYLRYCLQLVAAGDGSYSTALFPYEIIRKIHVQSRGNIGEINRLADKALRRAHAAGASEVSAGFL